MDKQKPAETQEFLEARPLELAKRAGEIVKAMGELDGAGKLAVLKVATSLVEARRDAEVFRVALAVNLQKLGGP